MSKPNFEKSNFQPEKRDETELSKKEKKEREAYEKTLEKFSEKIETKEARLKQDPTFKAQGRNYKIESKYDYMVAGAQTEINQAKEILKTARKQEDYYFEKAAAKLVQFLQDREALLESYAELKSNRPELAKKLEDQIPWLSGAYFQAKKQWQNWNQQQGKADE